MRTEKNQFHLASGRKELVSFVFKFQTIFIWWDKMVQCTSLDCALKDVVKLF